MPNVIGRKEEYGESPGRNINIMCIYRKPVTVDLEEAFSHCCSSHWKCIMNLVHEIKQALSNKRGQYVHCFVEGCSSYVPRLHRHINRHHPSLCSEACPNCPARFVTSADLKNHQRNGCPRGSQKRNRRKRKKNKTQQLAKSSFSWQCENCQKSFRTECALNQHQKDKKHRATPDSQKGQRQNFDEVDFSFRSSVNTFISQNLQLDESYKQDVLETVGTLGDKLKTHMKEYGYSVNKFVKAGSIAKGTAVKGKSDIDCVIFLNDFKTAKEHKDNLQKTKKDLKTCLEEHCNSDSLLLECLDETRFAVKIKVKLPHSERSFDVDLLPTFNADIETSLEKLYEDILDSDERERQFYSAALVQLQVDFVSHQPPNVKDLIRLVKCWRKTRLEDKAHLKLPSSYPLELITIHCWEKAKKPRTFDPRLGFKAVLERLVDYAQLRAFWLDNYKDLARRGEIDQSAPMVLDPANPANNVCKASYPQGWKEVKYAAFQTLQNPQLKRLNAGSNWQ